MIFYAIELLSVPEIIFACSVCVDNYKNRFRCEKDFLEIAVHEGGKTVFEFDDGTVSCSEVGDCSAVLQDFSCRTYSENNETNRHTTVGIKAEYRHERLCSDTADIAGLRDRVKNRRTILLPFHYPLGEYAKPFSEMIKQIIRKYTSANPADSIAAVAAWYEMAAYISEFTLRELEKVRISPAAQRYLAGAQSYIGEHFAEKLAVGDVARHIGISEGYLHHIFKSGTGFGVAEYISRCRVEAVKQYVRSRGVSLKDASAQVGIDDPSYMSRLFKKIAGVSFRKYRQSVFADD